MVSYELTFLIIPPYFARRVEKYRPNTLDDVEGHKDIIATINKFVDSNVRHLAPFSF